MVEAGHVVVVPVAQPGAERRGADVAVAAGVVAAELVGHVPQRERRVVLVALGEGRAQGQRVLAVDRRARAEGLPSPRGERAPVLGDGEHLRVPVGQPRRRRGGGGGEVDADARRVQVVHLPVEPGEVPGVRRGLQPRPREDPERDQVHAGLAHQGAVLHVGGGWPLLGVVVAPEGQSGQGTRHAATVATLTRQSQRFTVEKRWEMFEVVRIVTSGGLDGLWSVVTCCASLLGFVSRRPSCPAPHPRAIPRSTVATMAATRRSVLRGIGLSGLAVGGASLLAACGGDSGGPATGSAPP